jgi:3-oxoacyl-[acyl-carrier-protein] synthase-3
MSSLLIGDLGDGKPYIHMIGKEIYKFAVSTGSTEIPDAIEKAGLKQSDVDHVILHQANRRIMEAVAERLEIEKDKFAINIEEYGNTCSASIPLTLDKMNRNNLLKDGQIIVMTAFGGGLTSGTCVIEWNKGEK